MRRCASHRLFSMVLDVLTVCASSGQLMFAASSQLCPSVELPCCWFSLCIMVNITLDGRPCCLQIEEAQATLAAKEAEVEDLKQKMAQGLSEAQVLPASDGDPCSTAFTVHDSTYHNCIRDIAWEPSGNAHTRNNSSPATPWTPNTAQLAVTLTMVRLTGRQHGTAGGGAGSRAGALRGAGPAGAAALPS
jgi:hypothetical protein